MKIGNGTIVHASTSASSSSSSSSSSPPSMASIAPGEPECSPTTVGPSKPSEPISDRSIETVQGVPFEVAPRYVNLRFIGQGSYGIVASATDRRTGETVAIKKLSSIFEHQAYCQSTLREIRILTRFRHENVIDIRDIVCGESIDTLRDVYIVQSKMDADLGRVLRRNRLTPQHVCYFAYQICRAVKYVHSGNVLHRDLKPQNVLLNDDCELRIADFGLARIADPERNHAGFLTEYVATRYYRAPEVMLNSRGYSKAIDIWSVGCILAEMITARPLFPARHYLEHLNMILDCLGSPNDADLQWIMNPSARQYLQSLPRRERGSWRKILSTDTAVEMDPEIDPLAIDLLERMLCFDPHRRITAADALAHPYFAMYFDVTDSAIAAEEPLRYEMEFDDLPRERLKVLVFDEIKGFHLRRRRRHDRMDGL